MDMSCFYVVYVSKTIKVTIAKGFFELIGMFLRNKNVLIVLTISQYLVLDYAKVTIIF